MINNDGASSLYDVCDVVYHELRLKTFFLAQARLKEDQKEKIWLAVLKESYFKELKNCKAIF